MFAQVAVNVPSITGVFDYAIPKSLVGQVGIGHLVIVPFGRQTVQGVIFRFVDSPSVSNVKDILEVVDEEPVLTQPQIALAKEMADSTLQPLASIVALFLPVGLNQQADVLYSLRETELANQKSKTDPNTINPRTKKLTTEDKLLNLLRLRGSLRGRQIDTHFAKVDWRKTAGYLVRKGVLESKSILPPPRVRTKYIRVAQLAVPPEEALV